MAPAAAPMRNHLAARPIQRQALPPRAMRRASSRSRVSAAVFWRSSVTSAWAVVSFGGKEPGESCGDAGKFPARDVRGVYGGDGRAFVDVVGVDVGVRGLELQRDHSWGGTERAAEGDFDRLT